MLAEAERCDSGAQNEASWAPPADEDPSCAAEEPACAQQTLYNVLGVSITASGEAIRSAYRRLARAWHPDRHRGDELAKARFQSVQHAYEVLSDTSRRHDYDLNLLELLDVEEYLARFQGFILTACGLGMTSREDSMGLPGEGPTNGCTMSPQTSGAMCSWVSGSFNSFTSADGSVRGVDSPRTRSWFLLKAS